MTQVSVVVPTHDRAALIGETLEAILAQSVRPLEVIVVDDGSRDDTRAICARFGDAIRYLWQENRGVSAARNVGMRATRGDWVAFCDSDDVWHPTKLEVQLQVVSTTGARWCVSGCGLVGPAGEGRVSSRLGFEEVFPVFAELARSPEEHFTHWLSSQDVRVGNREIQVFAGDAFGLLFEGNVILPSAVLAARELLDDVGAFDESARAAEDTEYFHRVAARAPLAIVMDRLLDYRMGHPSLVSTSKAEALIETALRSIERAAALRPLTAAERRAAERGRRRLLMKLAYARLTALDRAGARESLRTAWPERRFPLDATALLLASYLPVPVLRGVHRAKRALRR